ncbi:MAG: glycosyltransferase family 9 protein [Candidatus Aminicenantes bacterium]|nr:glycosyltransferase family 9 protein [Candidatus Aminicenantes bacterium]
MGDLLTAFPALALLRDARPDSEFTLACREAYGLFFRECGLAEHVVSADSPMLTGLFGDCEKGSPRLDPWLARFDEVWGWMNGGSGAGLARSLAGHGARNVRIIGPPRRSSPRPLYTHYLEETARAAGCPFPGEETSKAYCRLKACRGDGSGRMSEASAPVIIHPGSGGKDKCWPLERFLEIVRRLSARGAEGLLVTGEAEERMAPALCSFRFPDGWNWMRRPPLRRLAELLARSRFYLGNDSGVTHLAAACGAPVLALFKEENAVFWRPCGNVEIFSAEKIGNISVDVVWEKISQLKTAHNRVQTAISVLLSKK